MARSIDSAFYRSPAWRNVRRIYIKSKRGLCEQCMKRGLYVPAVCVHHVEELTEENVHRPEIAYGFDNLMALCNDCHNEIHGRKRARRYEVRDDGHIEVK